MFSTDRVCVFSVDVPKECSDIDTLSGHVTVGFTQSPPECASSRAVVRFCHTYASSVTVT